MATRKEKYLAELAAREPRVREWRPGESSRGEFVAFFGQHDVLAPAALQRIAEALQAGPVDLLYTDEDRLNEHGRHVEPIFKPDWSPDLLLSCDYIGHLMVVSREDPDAPRALAICVPLTTQVRGGNYEVPLPRVRWLPGADAGVANVQGIASVELHRLKQKAGRFDGRVLAGIREHIAWMLELGNLPCRALG